jgi:hypothetical protein
VALAAQKRAEALRPAGETDPPSQPSPPHGSHPVVDLTHKASDVDRPAYDPESSHSPSVRFLSTYVANSPALAAIAAPLLPATEGEDPALSQQEVQFDPPALLKHLPQHIVNKPNWEEFDSQEEYEEEIERYLQYLLDLDRARFVLLLWLLHITLTPCSGSQIASTTKPVCILVMQSGKRLARFLITTPSDGSRIGVLRCRDLVAPFCPSKHMRFGTHFSKSKVCYYLSSLPTSWGLVRRR